MLKESEKLVSDNNLKEAKGALKIGRVFCHLHFTFADFSKPFVDEAGNIDAIFVLGHTDADRTFAIHPSFPSSFVVPSFADIKEVISLAGKLGQYSKKDSPLPQGKLAASLTEREKRISNLILIGSGAVNPLTREVFKILGDKLPVYF